MRGPLRLAAALACSVAAGVLWAGEPATLYNSHCALCHQAAGIGAKGQFPRLAGRLGSLALDAKGRAYLVNIVASGLSGTLVIDGAPVTGVMPPQALPAQDLAQILNYLSSLPPKPASRPKPFTAAEVTSLRAGGLLSRDQLLAERQALVEARVVQ